jgi:hypothetical protein
MTGNEKIKPTHLLRCSYVYVQQSKAAQVRYNREPADRQYKLAERALRLGWSQSQIKIIDEDELYRLGFLNDRLFGPSALALVPLPRSLLSLDVKSLLQDLLGHPHLYRHPSGLDQSNLYRAYLALVLPDESRSLIPAAWTDLDMNNFQHSCSYDGRSLSAALGSLVHLPRKVVDSLLRKIDASEQAPTILSKEESKRATTTRPLARRGNTAPGAEPLGRPRSRDAKNDHRHTVQIDQQGGLSKKSGGQP